MQLENKEVKSSIDSSRASLKIREESSACSEAMEGPNAGQKTPNPNNTIGSAATWIPHGDLVWGWNLDGQGRIAQRFLCLWSLFGGCTTQ